MRLILRKVGAGLAIGDWVLTVQDPGGDPGYSGDCAPVLVDWRNRVPQLLLSTTEYRLYPFWLADQHPPCRVCLRASAGSIVHEIDLVTIYEQDNADTAWEPLEIRCRVDGGAWSIWTPLGAGALQGLLTLIGAPAVVVAETFDPEVVWGGFKGWYAAAVRFSGGGPHVLEVEARKVECTCVVDFHTLWEATGELNGATQELRDCLALLGFRLEIPGLNCFSESADFDVTVFPCDHVSLRIVNNTAGDFLRIECHGTDGNFATADYQGPACEINGGSTLTKLTTNQPHLPETGLVQLICGTTTTIVTQVQRLQIGGGSTNDEFQWVDAPGGDYALTLAGETSGTISAPEDALPALEGITAAGDVAVYGMHPEGRSYLVEFRSGQGNQNLPEMTGSAGVSVIRVNNGGHVA